VLRRASRPRGRPGGQSATGAPPARASSATTAGWERASWPARTKAGRGCLAGPLVAAAVLFDYEALTLSELRSLSALNDSKQHTAEAREALYPKVLRVASCVAVTSRCVRGIDERGLHKTNLAALSDVLARVGRPGCLCLSDGFPVPPTGFDQRPVVGGDATSAAIAAASVIAKVTRDRFMQRMERRYPAGSSPRTSATRRRSTARRSRSTGSPRCTG
jgi:ribonuclease HII